MYQVFARKWRPQSLEELVGQSHVARTLRNALEGNRLAHAYLFAGLRGTGKTTVARILAKCLNCERGPTASPCNRCSSCLEIAEGRSLDVLEIDAASRTGVGDIRELQEVVAYAPVRDRYRVLVIDEVHMLSKNAFNALLKTLEEPPSRVVFILATTEIQKVLPTILSRCQVFEFRRVPAREVAAHLRRVCDAEGIAVSRETLERVAHAGEGSVRDSLSILERVVAFCGTEVKDEDALQILGAVRAEVLARMIRALAARDAAAMLTTLDAVVDEGHDLLHFWGELLGAVRDVELRRTLPDREDLVARPAEEAASLASAAEGLSREDLSRIFHLLADLEAGLKASAQPRFLFEAALVRLASLGAIVPIEEILASLGAPASAGPSRTLAGGAPSREPGVVRASNPQKKKDDPEPKAPPPAAVGTGDAAAFVAAIAAARPMLGAAIAHASILVADDGITISFGDAASGRMAERGDSMLVLRRCAEEIAGRPVAVRVVVPTASVPRAPEPTSSPATPRPPAEVPITSEPPREAASIDHRELLERARSEPGVGKLLREFGAQVIDIRPLEAPRPLEAEAPETSPVEETR